MRGEYLYTPPAEMLAQLLLELGEVESYSQERQTTSVHVRLTEMTAVLSTLIADSLMKLGDIRRSRGWYETARNAAEESGNVDLRARVKAQAAMLPFYYGPLDAAVAWAREARLLTMHRRPSPTAAFATAAEARALAHQGNVAAARARAQEAQDLFDRLPLLQRTTLSGSRPAASCSTSAARTPRWGRAPGPGGSRNKPWPCTQPARASTQRCSSWSAPSAWHMIAARRKRASWPPRPT